MPRLLKILVCATLICVWAGVASANVMYNFKANSSQVNSIGRLDYKRIIIPTYRTYIHFIKHDFHS